VHAETPFGWSVLVYAALSDQAPIPGGFGVGFAVKIKFQTDDSVLPKKKNPSQQKARFPLVDLLQQPLFCFF